jgi:hypothetical protein
MKKDERQLGKTGEFSDDHLSLKFEDLDILDPAATHQEQMMEELPDMQAH